MKLTLSSISARESNVQFLESDDIGEDLPGTEFYLTQPYAGGRAFATSVLDMLMITSFFTPSIVKIFHSLVFGGASLELERLLAEGAGLIGGPGISKTTKAHNQVLVVQIPVDSPSFRVYAVRILSISKSTPFYNICLSFV